MFLYIKTLFLERSPEGLNPCQVTPALSDLPSRGSTCPGPGTFQSAKEESEDRARERESSQGEEGGLKEWLLVYSRSANIQLKHEYWTLGQSGQE